MASSTAARLQQMTFRTQTSKAKAALQENHFSLAIQEYTLTLVTLGLEHSATVLLQPSSTNGDTGLSNSKPSLPLPPPPPPLYISTKNITQVYLGRSGAWFGCEMYWRAYEDAAQAVALDPHNLRAILRSGHCLLRMDFFQAAADVFRRGLLLHTDDKKLTEGFQRALTGLRVSWHKYLPSLDGADTGRTSKSTKSSTLPMPEDVLLDEDDDSGFNQVASIEPESAGSSSTAATTTELITDEESLARAAAKREVSEQRYISRLQKYGMVLDVHDLVLQEAGWWSSMGAKWRDQVAASRDIDQAKAKITKVLLRYKVSLTAVYLFYKNRKPTEESVTKQIEQRQQQQLAPSISTFTSSLSSMSVSNNNLVTIGTTTSSSSIDTSVTAIDDTQMNKTILHCPTPPPASATYRSSTVSPRRAKQILEASTVAVPLPTHMSHGMDQDVTSEQLTRFVCECGLVKNVDADMTAFHDILDKFQKDKGIMKQIVRRKSVLEIQREEIQEIQETSNKMNKNERNNGGDSNTKNTIIKKGRLISSAVPVLASVAVNSVQGAADYNVNSTPPTVLFPKFCELVVRLVLRKYPAGHRILTEIEVQKREDQLKGLSLIDATRKKREQEKKDRPPNLAERLSRGLDQMLSLLGNRLVGTSSTNYRWIPYRNRAEVQSAIKIMLPELRGIYLHLCKTSRCMNHISIFDILKFLVQMDFVDNTYFPLDHAARCFVSVTYFVGSVHSDLADFDHFVEVLVCCADARSNNGGMITIDARVRSFMKELLFKYEKKCLRRT